MLLCFPDCPQLPWRSVKIPKHRRALSCLWQRLQSHLSSRGLEQHLVFWEEPQAAFFEADGFEELASFTRGWGPAPGEADRQNSGLGVPAYSFSKANQILTNDFLIFES